MSEQSQVLNDNDADGSVDSNEPAKIISMPKDKDNKKEPDSDAFDSAYVEKLRRENAEKRIRATEASKKAEKLEKTLKAKLDEFESVRAKLEELKKEKESKELEKASDIEKLTKKLEELTSRVTEYEAEKEKKERMILELTEKTKLQDQKIKIEKLIALQAVSFSSKYEKEGFINQFLERDEDGDFRHDDESIIFELGEFKKSKAKAPANPPPGETNKKTEFPDGERLAALLAKDPAELTAKDMKEMEEIRYRIEESKRQ
jgi:hypothetical protein